jgi:hypothetical protein
MADQWMLFIKAASLFVLAMSVIGIVLDWIKD